MNTLLFDLDDTLYDLDMHRFRHIDSAWQEWLITLPPMMVPYVLQAAVTERIFFKDMPGFLGNYGVQEPMLSHLCAYSRATWFSDLRLDEGVAPLLDTLATRYKLGLITNGPSEIQRAKIVQFDLARWFTVLVVSEEFGVAKPDPAIFLHAANALASDPADCVMIGDNPDADIRGAQAAGMRSVWIQRPALYKKPFTRDEARYPADLPAPWRTIPHVRDLLRVLEEKCTLRRYLMRWNLCR
jgi:putative hydrolase of the HAD superfamily